MVAKYLLDYVGGGVWGVFMVGDPKPIRVGESPMDLYNHCHDHGMPVRASECAAECIMALMPTGAGLWPSGQEW